MRDPEKHLEVDPSAGTLSLYLWRVESFDFLNAFEGIRAPFPEEEQEQIWNMNDSILDVELR